MVAVLEQPGTYHAAHIDGWLEGQCMRWIARQAPKYQRIVEVGTWKGRSCAIWCEFSAPDAKVWAVDHFHGSYQEAASLHNQAVVDRGGLMIETLTNLKPWVNSGKLDFLVMDSLQAAASWPIIVGGQVDCVWIDGSHQTEAVLADIAAWLPRIRPGGLICGHDVGWASVQAALNQSLPGWTEEDGAWWKVVG